jgi:hypothetical protein
MFRLRAAALAGGLLVTTAGLLAGEAIAAPAFTPGVQTPQPMARPLLANYILPVPLTAADTIAVIEVGRDDTSPYAQIIVNFAPGNPVPPMPFPRGMPTPFVYRPIWDSALYPNLTNAVGAPVAGMADGQVTAIDVFVKAVQNYRTSATPAGQLWLDTLSPAGSLNNNEFYKFRISY